MKIRTLSLVDWRSYEQTSLSFGDGLTTIIGENGHGKTNVLEAIGWLAGIGSFRRAPDEALVRVGADAAVIRSTVEADDGREQLIEIEIPRIGRNRIQVNRQRLNRTGDLAGVLQVTVFSPDDLDLVKGAPALRRGWLDLAVASRHPKNISLRSDVERILKQRNALLRGVHGKLDIDAAFTLDVWDSKLAETGERLVAARLDLLDEMTTTLAGAYDAVAQAAAHATARYQASWDGPLVDALAANRDLDIRRGVTTVGPHRDDVVLSLGAMPARTHASQGEQRSLALALRLAADGVVRDAGVAEPVLLLDDVFSELDANRAGALLEALPAGQHILTTAAGLPPAARPENVVRVHDGVLTVGER
ncbi:MAG: DNA replication/repair protein RecF [Acidimicrobiales bacterium]|nr:DNA replication/repair protein RecF [Acidimicrobiales bacterium]MDG1876322.1 DNA replication/repair protein RecF [Acidimicrobiales bacterium]